MPSPFPGMNPYLEQPGVWHDFHESFIPRARDWIAAQVLPRYFVRIDEHIYVHELSAEERRFLGRADVAVTPNGGTSSITAGAAIVAPHEVHLAVAVDVERHSFLEIRDRENRQVVTVLELLSPANKRPGSDREQYEGKRRQLLFSPVHLVEIDLLRGGNRMPVVDPLPCDYCVLVSRAHERPRAGMWTWSLPDPMPVVPVPLRAGEPDATLDMKAVIESIYDAAGYGFYMYQREPEPPLTVEQQEWAKRFVPAKQSP